MSYLVFPTAAAAEMAQVVILKLASRALWHRGYDRDESDIVSTGIKNGVKVPAITDRWSDVTACNEGFAIVSPSGRDLFEAMLEDTPATLATGWGMDPDSVPWAALGFPVGNPRTPTSLPGEAWCRGSFAAVGLPWVEVDTITFPEEPA